MSERGLSLGGYKADFSREARSLPVFTMAPHAQAEYEVPNSDSCLCVLEMGEGGR